MKRSAAKPYEGTEPYLFVSYCHKDRCIVLPVIEKLMRDGYRIWYDEGINPGSDWSEVIADHLSRSSLCVAIISENAVASHNCRREINYALLKQIPLLSVFLEETVLTPGMEMQLSANQYIFAYEYKDIMKCLRIVALMPEFKPCLGLPNPLIKVRAPEYYFEPIPEIDNKPAGLRDEWFLSEQKPETSQPEQTEETDTILQEDQESKQVLIRKSTGEEIPLSNGTLYFGRQSSIAKNCCVISGNVAVSREHFVVIWQNGEYTIRDCNSRNGTFLNGAAISPKEAVNLKVGDEIRASSEVFVFSEKW